MTFASDGTLWGMFDTTCIGDYKLGTIDTSTGNVSLLAQLATPAGNDVAFDGLPLYDVVNGNIGQLDTSTGAAGSFYACNTFGYGVAFGGDGLAWRGGYNQVYAYALGGSCTGSGGGSPGSGRRRAAPAPLLCERNYVCPRPAELPSRVLRRQHVPWRRNSVIDDHRKRVRRHELAGRLQRHDLHARTRVHVSHGRRARRTRRVPVQSFDRDLASRNPGMLIHSWGAREEHTLALMAQWLDGLPAGKPFFLEYITAATHHPCGTPPGYRAPFAASDPESLYRNAIHYTDRAIGVLLDALDRRGVLQDTLVAITGDHGEAFGAHPMNVLHKSFRTRRTSAAFCC